VVTKRELVGRVWIDSGTLLVCDPMYGALSERDQRALIDDGADVTHCDFDDTDAKGSPDHLGVAVASGFGDGLYGVWVERAEFDGQEFISRVIIDFLVTPEGARELDEALAEQSADGVEDVVRSWALGEAS
jgi:hypothetical protein